MARVKRVTVAVAASLTLMISSGCTRLQTHEGYIAEAALVDSVAIGIDNRASVERTLGRPTFAGQFGTVGGGAGRMVTPEEANDWYYVSRNTRALAFANPRATEQLVLHVQFDAAGNVTAINRSDVSAIVRLNPESDKTPTLGRERGLLEDIFGNIGAVGAPGAGGGAPGG
jgi:outer membrane protein assembly factor BamE (lipoprotein component of BamABCDE complex)